MKIVRVAKPQEIPAGSMNHVEAGGVDCTLNAGGRFFAIGDQGARECPALATSACGEARFFLKDRVSFFGYRASSYFLSAGSPGFS